MKAITCTIITIFAIALVALVTLVVIVAKKSRSNSATEAQWRTDAPYYGQKYADLPGARGFFVDEVGDLVVVSKTAGTITAVYETPNQSGGVNVCKVVLINAAPTPLNHGIAYSRGYIYASSSTNVYRWPYKPGQRAPIASRAEEVVYGIPAPGHATRSIIFDAEGHLYVSVGSQENVDLNSNRARIRRFPITAKLPLEFSKGEVYADGLRNEVGITFDNQGVLWGVECSADSLTRSDLGGDIHKGNPAEELNRFGAGQSHNFHGYPYCFSSGVLPGFAAGTQFVWPTFMSDGVHSDEWCRKEEHNHGPALALPAHSAPLGIEFYDAHNCSLSVGAFPCGYEGDAFIAFHGSYAASDVRAGYSVKRYVYNKSTLLPSGETVNVIYEPEVLNCENCFRPVAAVFDGNGHLFVSDDENGAIFRIYYGSPPPAVAQSCSASLLT